MQKEVIKPDAAKIPQKPDNAYAPPHSVHLHFKKRTIDIRVTLHKIPEKYVNIVPLAGKFHVDTVGWTKKAWLQLAYPQGAKVDVDRGQAVLDSGILNVTLPLSECIDKETGERVKFDKHGDIVYEKKEAKKPKKQAAADESAPVPKKKSPKKPEPASAFEDKMDVSDDDDDESEESDEPVEQEKPKKAIKKKVPVHAMTTEQLEEKRMRQQKKAPAAKDFALSVIDQLAAVEDKKRTDFLKKEDQKLKHFEEKEKIREEKKQAKQERAKVAAQQALAERKKKLKAAREAKKALEDDAADEADAAPAPKPEKKRKVSFSDASPKATKKSKTH